MFDKIIRICEKRNIEKSTKCDYELKGILYNDKKLYVEECKKIIWIYWLQGYETKLDLIAYGFI